MSDSVFDRLNKEIENQKRQQAATPASAIKSDLDSSLRFIASPAPIVPATKPPVRSDLDSAMRFISPETSQPAVTPPSQPEPFKVFGVQIPPSMPPNSPPAAQSAPPATTIPAQPIASPEGHPSPIQTPNTGIVAGSPGVPGQDEFQTRLSAPGGSVPQVTPKPELTAEQIAVAPPVTESPVFGKVVPDEEFARQALGAPRLDSTKLPTYTPAPESKTLMEGAKHGISQSGVMMVGGAAGLAQMTGENILKISTAMGMDGNRGAQELADWGKKVAAWIPAYQQQHPEEQMAMAKGQGFVKSLGEMIAKPENIVQGLLTTAPLLLSGVVASKVGGAIAGTIGAGAKVIPWAARVMSLGAPVAGETYSQARAQGTPVGSATAQALLSGVIEGAIEEFTLGRKLDILKGAMGRAITRGASQTTAEMLLRSFVRGTAEEASQSVNRNFWNWVFTDRSQNILQGVGDEAAAGGLLEMVMSGGAMAGGKAWSTMLPVKQQVQIIDDLDTIISGSGTFNDQQKAEIRQELGRVKEEAAKGEFKEPIQDVIQPPGQGVPDLRATQSVPPEQAPTVTQEIVPGGAPIVIPWEGKLYHGGNLGGEYKRGISLTPSPIQAYEFSRRVSDRKFIQADVKLDNPLVGKNIEIVAEKLGVGDKLYNIQKEDSAAGRPIGDFSRIDKLLNESAINAGYDGIVFGNPSDPNEVRVFDKDKLSNISEPKKEVFSKYPSHVLAEFPELATSARISTAQPPVVSQQPAISDTQAVAPATPSAELAPPPQPAPAGALGAEPAVKAREGVPLATQAPAPSTAQGGEGAEKAAPPAKPNLAAEATTPPREPIALKVGEKYGTPQGKVARVERIEGDKVWYRMGRKAGNITIEQAKSTWETLIPEGEKVGEPAPPSQPPAAVAEEKVPARPVDKYLNEQINYGGEIRTRGSVITEMQGRGVPQKQIDAYMMGAKPETPPAPPVAATSAEVAGKVPAPEAAAKPAEPSAQAEYPFSVEQDASITKEVGKFNSSARVSISDAQVKTMLTDRALKEGIALKDMPGDKAAAWIDTALRGEKTTNAKGEIVRSGGILNELRQGERNTVELGEDVGEVAGTGEEEIRAGAETVKPDNARRQEIVANAMPKIKGNPLNRIVAAAFHKTLGADLAGKSLIKEVRNAVTDIAKNGYNPLGVKGGYIKTILDDNFRKSYDKVSKMLRETATLNVAPRNTPTESKIADMTEKNLKDVQEYNAKKEQSGSLTLPSPIMFEKRSWSDVQNAALRKVLDVSRTPMDLVGAIKAYAIDKITRLREALVFYPKIRKFPVYRNDLRKAMDMPTDAINQADINLYGIVGKQKHDRKGYNTFRHIVALEDIIRDAEQDKPIPGGFAIADLKNELEYQYSIASPEVKEATQKHFDMMKAVAEDLVARGKMKAEDVKERYYHHAVMDYQTPWGDFIGLPRRIKIPRRAYLKERKGTERLIDMDYIGVTRSHLSQVFLDNALDDWIDKQGNMYDLKSSMTSDQWKAFKEEHPPTPGGIVDHEGQRYRWFQFQPGNTFLPGKRITENTLARAIEANMTVRELAELKGPQGGDAIADALFMGGKHKMYLIPEEIADTFAKLRQPAGDFYDLSREVFRGTALWKRMVIDLGGLPIRIPNMLSDSMKLYIHDPKAYFNVPKAIGLIVRHHPTFQRWFGAKLTEADHNMLNLLHQEGVDKASIYREMSYVLNDDALYNMRHPYMRFNPFKYISRAWEGMVQDTEAIWRYAKFITDMQRIYSGNNVHSSTLDGVKELDEKGFKVEAAGRAARLVTVDYREVSSTYSRWGRGLITPFITWFDYTGRDITTNFVKSKGMGIAKMLVPYALMFLWNNSGDRRKDEEKLPPYVRWMFHINTGFRDKDGKAIVISMMTPYDAWAKWGGLDRVGEKITKVRAGQMGLGEAVVEQLIDMAKGPGRNLRSLLHPLAQVAYGLIANKHPVFGTPIVPDGTGPSKSNDLMAKFFASAFITPYAQYLRTTRDYEPGDVWSKYLFDGGPLDIEKAFGFRRIDLAKEQRKAVDTEVREKVLPKFNNARDKLQDGFIKWQGTGDRGEFDKAVEYTKNAVKDGIAITENDVVKWLQKPRVGLAILKEKLRLAKPDSEEYKSLKDMIRTQEEMMWVDKLENLPKSILPSVVNVINSIYNEKQEEIKQPDWEGIIEEGPGADLERSLRETK